MKHIDHLFQLQQRNQQYNGWFKDSSEFYYFHGILDEMEEIRKELMLQKLPELEDEVGDLIWCVMNFVGKLEDKGMIDIERMMKNTHLKFSERLPYVVEGRFEGDKAKRSQLWNEAKRKQKERKMEKI
jgi:NTP pyrophosphatase (non-canonical NTP hydrolase)